jgi:ribosomal protein L22
MNYSDEEVELIAEWSAARKRFVAAKAGREKDPDEYTAAKAKMSELRTQWREIRAAVGNVSGPSDDDATVAVESVQTGTSVNTERKG